MSTAASTEAGPAAASTADLIARLVQLLGRDRVATDARERLFAGTDVFRAGELPAAVVRPGCVDHLQQIVRLCAEYATPLTVRGGGASYTDGYGHRHAGGVTIDTRDFAAIVEIDEANAYVTVQAGCTWAALHEALSARGFRTPFFGPFSGLVATVGGSMSQNAISHGTGAHGVSAQSALAFDIVTGTGDLLRTGTAGNRVAKPFFRFFGPDMAGLFTGDCGALGIKAHITLPIIRRHEAFEAASFAFDDFAGMHGAMRAIAVEQLDDENFALDQTLQRGQLGRQEGLGNKLGMAKSVLASADSLGSGLTRIAKMAAAGDRDLRGGAYVSHYVIEAVDRAAAQAKRKRLTAIAKGFGREIANSVPTVVRGMPFAPLTNTLGPQGERWVPMHGLFPHDAVVDFHQALRAYFERKAELMDRFGIVAGGMFMSVGPTAFVYEPAFYWPDARTVYHEREVPSAHLENLPVHAAREGATAAIAEIRGEIAHLMQDFGAAHLQIGKVYGYLPDRNPASVALLKAVKAELDPHGILNPGALGL